MLGDSAQGQVSSKGPIFNRVSQREGDYFDTLLQGEQLLGSLYPDPNHPRPARVRKSAERAHVDIKRIVAAGFLSKCCLQGLNLGNFNVTQEFDSQVDIFCWQPAHGFRPWTELLDNLSQPVLYGGWQFDGNKSA